MRKLPFLLVALFWTGFATQVVAQDDGEENQTPETLRVAVKEAAPFVIKSEDGHWDGLAIDLWEEAAEDAGYSAEFVEAELGTLFEGVASGKYHAGLGALTVTADREGKVDFTHPYFSTGLAIAVPKEGRAGWFTVLRRFFTLEFLSVIFSLLILLLVVGIAVWLFERKANPDEFGGPLLKGFGNGLWWSAVTMTTVGYGDKTPRSMGGRIVGLIWMFAAIIVISGFTASIASSLTVGNLSSNINSLDDLNHSRIGTVENSTSAAFLDEQGIGYQGFSNLNEALKELDAGRLRAVVYDRPILQYLIKQGRHSSLRILPGYFDDQSYAFALPPNSPLREDLNLRMLEVLASENWSSILDGYLGEDRSTQ